MLANFFKGILALFMGGIRERYPSAFAIFGEVFGIFMSLSFYWFTSQAISTHLSFNGDEHQPFLHYFDFVVLGDASLALPMVAFGSVLRKVREAQGDGTLEAIFLLPHRWQFMTILPALPVILQQLIRSNVILLAAHGVLGLNLSFGNLLSWNVIELIGLPLFFGLGWVTTGIFLKFGRGEAFTNYVASLAAILGGVYFPTTVFPTFARDILKSFSPINTLIATVRAYVEGGWSQEVFKMVSFLVLWDVGAILVGWMILSVGLNAFRERGSPEVLY